MRYMNWNWHDYQSAPVRLVERIEEEVRAENERNARAAAKPKKR